MKFKIESPDKIEAKESDYLYIKESQLLKAGKGLFTSLQIYKNEIISVFKGEILTNEEAERRAKNGKDGYFINMLDGTIMDSMKVKSFAKYANDSQGLFKTNFKINSTITLDDENNVCLVAIRNVKIGEEIFCSYGTKYWENFKKQSKVRHNI